MIKNVLLYSLFLPMTLLNAQDNYELLVYDQDETYTQEFIDSLSYDYASGINRYDYRASVLKKVLDNNPSLDGWMAYYLTKAAIVYRENKFDSTRYYANKSYAHYQNLETKNKIGEHLLIRTYSLMAESLRIQKKTDKALVYLQKALDLSKKYPYKWRSYIIGDIGEIYLNDGFEGTALKYFEQTVEDSLYMSYPRNAILTYGKIAVLQEEYQKQIDKAKKSYHKAIKISNKNGHKYALSGLHGNLGALYYSEKKIDSSLWYYRKAITTYTNDNTLNSNGGLYDSFYKIKVLFLEKNYKEAITPLVTLKNEIHKIDRLDRDDMGLLSQVYNLLISSYVETGNVYNANRELLELENFLEAFYKNKYAERIDELEISYQSKEKDVSIAQLEEDKKSQEIISKQSKLINWILGVLLVSLISIGFITIKQRKQKIRYNTAVLEQKLLRSQLNPHFIFNALSTASNLAHNKSNLAVDYLSNLGSLLRRVLENSREEFISLDEEIQTLSHYLKLQSSFSSKFTFDISIDANIDDLGEILLPPMFIQPFVENAIEHGFQGLEGEELKVLFSIEGKSLLCSIIDNGIGYSKTKSLIKSTNQKSLSGKILKERLEVYAKRFKSKAYFLINDRSMEEGGGTQVRLILPLIKDI